MATPAEKRKLTRERRILRNEARWLQKTLFALSKAEDEHTKLLELREVEEDDVPFDVTVDGTSHEISEVTAGLKEAVNEWLELQRTALRDARAMARSA